MAPKTVPYLVLWWLFVVPVVMLDVKIYGQWFTKRKSETTWSLVQSMQQILLSHVQPMFFKVLGAQEEETTEHALATWFGSQQVALGKMDKIEGGKQVRPQRAMEQTRSFNMGYLEIKERSSIQEKFSRPEIHNHNDQTSR
ncbi:hypothetical protein AHAS_Ahas13G0450700 [Arachis hypogaea]